jgi:hypothetical protein
MKKILFTIFLCSIVVLTGCSNTSNKINEQDDLSIAENALISFFDHLDSQNFEKALELFELNHSADSWEGLEIFSLPEERDNRAQVLKNYCAATGTCLKAMVIDTIKENEETYNLLVQFKRADGSIFILGPCCGATEEEMPSQKEFNFKVKKINNEFKVITTPIYVP